jgi:hypothetical protein
LLELLSEQMLRSANGKSNISSNESGESVCGKRPDCATGGDVCAYRMKCALQDESGAFGGESTLNHDDVDRMAEVCHSIGG